MSRKRNAEHEVEEWEVSDLGIDHEQYFQGAGTSFTRWDEVFVGIGEDFNEALDDALENAAQYGVDGADLDEIDKADKIPQKEADKASVSAYLEENAEDGDEDDEDADPSDAHYYVALYVKWSGEDE